VNDAFPFLLIFFFFFFFSLSSSPSLFFLLEGGADYDKGNVFKGGSPVIFLSPPPLSFLFSVLFFPNLEACRQMLRWLMA